MIKIFIIGIGGRTGSMFAYELENAGDITGVGMDREIGLIAEKKIVIQKNGIIAGPLRTKTINAKDFADSAKKELPDFVMLCTKNPVGGAVMSYYRQLAGIEKMPGLILAQNGLSAIEDARVALRSALGQEAGGVNIIRASLINGIDLKINNDGTSTISYKTPIKIAFGFLDGTGKDDSLSDVFKVAGFRAQKFSGRKVPEMENSKLFTNLIGMASAVNGLPVSVGLRDKKIFKEEVAILKEYVLAARAGGLGFVADFLGYPVKLLAQTMLLPVSLLLPFRGAFESIVAKGRNRPKDLSEIDYYNGEVVKLGKKYGIAVPVNEAIVAKAKEILEKRYGQPL